MISGWPDFPMIGCMHINVKCVFFNYYYYKKQSGYTTFVSSFNLYVYLNRWFSLYMAKRGIIMALAPKYSYNKKEKIIFKQLYKFHQVFLT